MEGIKTYSVPEELIEMFFELPKEYKQDNNINLLCYKLGLFHASLLTIVAGQGYKPKQD